ncbi:MAG: lysophospholipid acyltransferase family protein [Halothiobacillaceae bacterium]
MLATVRALAFLTGNLITLVVMLPVVAISPLLPFRFRYRLLYHWGRFVLWWARVTVGLRWRVEGREHLPPAGSGRLILAKHQSTWETFFFPSLLHYPAFVLKRELLRIPIFGWGLSAIGPIAIDRADGRKALTSMIRQSREALEQGRDVVIFPEGTRKRPGTPPNYRIGGAAVAVACGRSVVPIALNSGCFWPKGALHKRAGTIEVIIGPPIETEGRRAEEVNTEVRTWIEQQMDRIGRPTDP